MQVLEDVGFTDVSLVEGAGVGGVMEPVFPGVCLSRHPQNHPGVEQWCDAVGDLDELVGDVGTRQSPNQPR